MREGLLLRGRPGSHGPLQAPGLLVGAQTAHGTVAGAAADTRVGGGEAADRTEGALGPGRGSRTGRQVVRALGHTQVLLLQQGLKVLSEAKFKMIPSGFLLFLSYRGRAVTVYPLTDEGLRGADLLHVVRNLWGPFNSPTPQIAFCRPEALLITETGS